MAENGKSNNNRLQVCRVIDVPLHEVSGICLGYVGVAERDGLEPGRFPSRREHDLPSSPSAETGAFVVLDAPLL
jgi:hypothetical protein